MSLTGIPKESGKGSGGILVCYGALLSELTGSTTASNGEATFHAPAGAFKKFVLGKEAGSNFVSTMTGSVANGTNSYDDVLTMIFKRNQVSKRNEAKVLAENETVWVINDNSQRNPTGDCTIGNLYVIGLPVCINPGGCEARTIVMNTGAQLADANNMTVTVGVMETIPPLSVSDATYLAIVAGEAF